MIQGLVELPHVLACLGLNFLTRKNNLVSSGTEAVNLFLLMDYVGMVLENRLRLWKLLLMPVAAVATSSM